VVGVDLEWKDWIGVEAVEGIECPVPWQVPVYFHWEHNLEAAAAAAAVAAVQ
jgi:hypothetical protein